MASLREIAPLIIGGLAGAGLPQGAEAVSQAAAWSERLKQNDLMEKHREEEAANSARRLELAVKQEKTNRKEFRIRKKAGEERSAYYARQQGEVDRKNQEFEQQRQYWGNKAAEQGLDPTPFLNSGSATELDRYVSDNYLNKDYDTARKAFEEEKGQLSPGSSIQFQGPGYQESFSSPRQVVSNPIDVGSVEGALGSLAFDFDKKAKQTQSKIEETERQIAALEGEGLDPSDARFSKLNSKLLELQQELEFIPDEQWHKSREKLAKMKLTPRQISQAIGEKSPSQVRADEQQAQQVGQLLQSSHQSTSSVPTPTDFLNQQIGGTARGANQVPF
jgi:hypothetical protein